MTEKKHFFNALNDASAAMPLNKTVQLLERDHQAVLDIYAELSNMGQTHVINMVKCSKDAMISLPFYAGDGVVIKVMPFSYAGNQETSLYRLPSITETCIKGTEQDFLIKSYPYLSQRDVQKGDIEVIRAKLNRVWLQFNAGDDNARNLAKLPDRDGTLVGIDDDMYCLASQRDEEQLSLLRTAWSDYVEKVFPIYTLRCLAPQTEKTDFRFVSVPSSEAHTLSFNPVGNDCEVSNAEIEGEHKKAQSVFGYLRNMLVYDQP